MVLFMILVSYPYIWPQIISVPNLSVLYGAILVLMACAVLSKGLPKAMPRQFVTCILIQVICCLFFSFYHGDSYYYIKIFYLILTLTVLAVFKGVDDILRFNEKNNALLAIQAVLGTIGFVLIFVGFIHPIMQVENADGRLSDLYLFCNVRGVLMSNIKRICGFFDEPGSFAFWGIYALIINKLYINNKYVEYSLVIGLLFTLSMAYYIQLVMYFMIFFSSKKSVGKNERNNKWSLVLLLLLVVALGALVYADKDSELFLRTFGRFGFGGNVIDNNREELMETTRKYFLMNPLMGVSPSYIYSLDTGVMDNPYETLATDGVLGTIVIYLPLIYVLFYGQRLEKMALIILVAGYMQRPLHTQFIHYLMLYMFMYIVVAMRNRRNRTQKIQVVNNENKCYNNYIKC